MDGFYVGDIIGNSYTHENEKYNLKTKDFETIDFNKLWNSRFKNLNENKNMVPDKSEFRKILHSFLDNTDSKPYILKYIKMRTDKEFDLTKIGNELKEKP